MTPVSLELPIRAREAGALTDLVFEHAENRELNQAIRARLGTRIAAQSFSSMRPFPGSLQRDPVHAATYYIVVDPIGLDTNTRLLRLAFDSSPSSGIFPDELLIARLRTTSGREAVINAIPFSPRDHEHIRKYAEGVDRQFLPRVAGAAPSVEVPTPDFDSFRRILKSMRVNLAAVSATGIWSQSVWQAIRAGWREGWSATLAVASVEAARQALPFLKDFSRVSIPAGPSALEIHAVLSATSHPFDCEIDFHDEPDPTTPQQVSSALQAFRAGARPVQFVAPRIDPEPRGNFEDRILLLHQTARHANALLTVSEPDPERLARIGKITRGRVNYKGPGDVFRIAELLRS